MLNFPASSQKYLKYFDFTSTNTLACFTLKIELSYIYIYVSVTNRDHQNLDATLAI